MSFTGDCTDGGTSDLRSQREGTGSAPGRRHAHAGIAVGIVLGLAAACCWPYWRTGARRAVTRWGPRSWAHRRSDPLAGLGPQEPGRAAGRGGVARWHRQGQCWPTGRARAMGMLRASAVPGTIDAHPILRTLAGPGAAHRVCRARWSWICRAAAEGGGAEPLGVHLRAVALGGGLSRGGGRRHRGAPGGPGAPRLRRQRQPRAEDPDRRAAAARRGAAGRDRPGRDRRRTRSTRRGGGRRFAERIQRESTRLGRLVSELLELSRLQGAEPLPDPEPVIGRQGGRRGARPDPDGRRGQADRARSSSATAA